MKIRRLNKIVLFLTSEKALSFYGGILAATIFFFFYEEAKLFYEENKNFIREYQTLLAGLLAIIAAFIGGHYVLKAAKYPISFQAISEAKRYISNLIAVHSLIVQEINKIKKGNTDKKSFLKVCVLIQNQLKEMEPGTLQELGLSGRNMMFMTVANFFLILANDVNRENLSLSNDQETIIPVLEDLMNAAMSFEREITEKVKELENTLK